MAWLLGIAACMITLDNIALSFTWFECVLTGTP